MMKVIASNLRISSKERGLIKGALRRVFSRSDLRKSVFMAASYSAIKEHRPKVKRWAKCSTCNKEYPAYLCEVDHVEPVVPLDRSLDEMTWDELLDRLWCNPSNLKVICKMCHKSKCLEENKLRRVNKSAKIDKGAL